METIEWISSIPKGPKRKAALAYHQQSKCMRGLEELTPGGLRRKVSNIKRAIRVVLDEQERQSQMYLGGIKRMVVVPELVSELYFQTTFDCLERSFTRAMKDCCDVYPEHAQTLLRQR